MPLIVTRIPRKRQPQGGVAAAATPLPELLWLASSPRRPVIGPGESGTTVAVTPDAGGLKIGSAASGAYWAADTYLSPALNSPSHTVIAHIRRGSSSRMCLASHRENGFGYRIEASSVVGTAWGLADYTINGGAISGECVIALVNDGATLECYINGDPYGSVASGTSISTGHGGRFAIGALAAGGESPLQAGDYIYSVAIFASAWPLLAKAIKGPGDYYGRLFAPIERRIWMPSAGSAVPNITAVYADSVTASSVVPRVTLDYA